MLLVCPHCGYDLTGLIGDRSAQCPECGSHVTPDQIDAKLNRTWSRRWNWFAIAPLAALPAAASPPLAAAVSAVACTIFAYRALRFDHALFQRRPSRPRLWFESVFLGFAWTAAATMLLAILFFR